VAVAVFAAETLPDGVNSKNTVTKRKRLKGRVALWFAALVSRDYTDWL